MSEEVVKVKPMALAMPQTAALVAELRQRCGDALVNAALAAGQRAKREYSRLEAEKGTHAANAWLSRQKFPQGRFWASEGVSEVGVRLGGDDGAH